MRFGSKVFPPGEVADVVLGRGEELHGTRLMIKSVVTDTNDKTNNTSLTYLLNGGIAPLQSVVSATVEAEGDSVVYRVTLDLI